MPTNAALFLIFDKPPMLPRDGVFTLSSQGDPNVAVKVEAIDWLNALIVRPQGLLRGNQDYTLRADKLYDRYGGQLSTNALLRFRTAVLPETHAFQAVSVPQTSLPNVSRVQWRFSRAVNPHILPRLGRIDSGAVSLSDVRLLADGVTIEATVPGPGRYILAGAVYDRVESKAASLSSNEIAVSAARDNRPPSPIAIFPSHPTAAAPPSVSPAVLFDETVDPLIVNQAVLRRGDEQIVADISVSGDRLTIKPRQPLAEGDYTAEVRAPRDLAGNAAADVKWSFHVDAAPPGEPFRLVHVDPADGTQGVDAHSSLVFTFNRPPNPLSIVTSFRTPVNSVWGPVAGRWRFEDTQAIFDPDPVFPPDTRILWDMRFVADFAGLTATGVGGFWVSSFTPESAFRVATLAPAPGETAGSGDAAITLEFNQPAAASTVSDRTIALLSDGKYQNIRVSYDAARRLALISTDILATGTFRVMAGPGILSQSGAPLEPFSAEVQLKWRTLSYSYSTERKLGPFIRASRPATGDSQPVDAPLVVFFTQPMQRDLVERGLRVVVGTTVVSGRIEWTPDSTALTFYPLRPLPAPASGIIMLSMVPWGGAGAETLPFDPIRPCAGAWSACFLRFPETPSSMSSSPGTGPPILLSRRA